MDEPTYEELKTQLEAAHAKLDEQAAAAPAEDKAEVVTDAEIVPEDAPINAAGSMEPAPSTAPAPDPQPSRTSLPSDWPVKGYTGPQPWEVDEPPVLGHEHGFLITGSAGADVERLSSLLAYAGYETSISRGENPLGLYDGSVRSAVEQFRRDYGIQEDPGVVAAATPDVVGPWTWSALYRLGRRPKED